MRYSQIASRVFDVPLLVARAKLRAVLSALGPRMGFDVALADGGIRIKPGAGIYEEPLPSLPDDDDDEDGLVCADRCGYRIDLGVARIQIIGTLVHRSSYMMAESGLTSYLGVSDALARAIEDDDVHAVLLEIDSPGGEANGCFDLADEIYAARGEKPIWAIAVDWADSAAYLIASAADKIVVTQSGEVGSIGVVWSHCDFSAQDKMLGVAVTYLYAGERKIDGNPDQPLSDPARARFQSEIEKLYGLFVNAVARNRSLSADQVRATEALTYIGGDGIAIGLADQVGTLRDTLSLLAAMAPRPEQITGATSGAIDYAQQEQVSMTDKTKAPVVVETAAEFKPLPSAAAVTIDRAAVTAEAVANERSRVGSILGSDDANGREELARHLAFETDMTAAGALAVLAKAPKQQAVAAVPSTPSRFDAAMQAAGNPNVGHESPISDDQASVDAFVAKTMAIYKGNQRSA